MMDENIIEEEEEDIDEENGDASDAENDHQLYIEEDYDEDDGGAYFDISFKSLNNS